MGVIRLMRHSEEHLGWLFAMQRKVQVSRCAAGFLY